MRSTLKISAAAAGTTALTWIILFIISWRTAEAAGQCIENLKRIDSAKLQWGLSLLEATNPPVGPITSYSIHKILETNGIAHLVPSVDDIRVYLSGDNQMPRCPRSGTYTVGRVGDPPTCSISRHNIELGRVYIYVEEDRRNPMKEAVVAVTDESGHEWSQRTDQNGCAVFMTWQKKVVSVVVSKEGFITFSNAYPLPEGKTDQGSILLQRKPFR